MVSSSFGLWVYGSFKIAFTVADELVKPDVRVFEVSALTSESLALIMRDHA